jgi:hypothetical protein
MGFRVVSWIDPIRRDKISVVLDVGSKRMEMFLVLGLGEGGEITNPAREGSGVDKFCNAIRKERL